jgi:hypothetical protein
MENKSMKCTCERPDDYTCDYCDEQESKRILKEAKERHNLQETVEEAFEEISKYLEDYENKDTYRSGFMDGAKWQAERTCNHNYILTAEKGHRVIKCSTCNDTRPI